MENKDSDIIPLLYFGFRPVIIIVLKTAKTQRGGGVPLLFLMVLHPGDTERNEKGKSGPARTRMRNFSSSQDYGISLNRIQRLTSREEELRKEDSSDVQAGRKMADLQQIKMPIKDSLGIHWVFSKISGN